MYSFSFVFSASFSSTILGDLRIFFRDPRWAELWPIEADGNTTVQIIVFSMSLGRGRDCQNRQGKTYNSRNYQPFYPSSETSKSYPLFSILFSRVLKDRCPSENRIYINLRRSGDFSKNSRKRLNFILQFSEFLPSFFITILKHYPHTLSSSFFSKFSRTGVLQRTVDFFI